MKNTTNQFKNDSVQWTIRFFCPEDAPGVVALYHEIYGDKFPFAAVYDPEWHIRQFYSRDSFMLVATLPKHKIVGCFSLYRSVSTNRNLFEAGAMLVSADFRFDNLPRALSQTIVDEAKNNLKITDIWAETVCNNRVTQMISIKQGYGYCALEVDPMPENAYLKLTERGLNTQSRVSSGVLFRSSRTIGDDLYLPTCYAEVLEGIYSALPFHHRFTLSPDGFEPESVPSELLVENNTNAQMSRVTVQTIGKDFSEKIQALGDNFQTLGIKVAQVILPLNSPAVGTAVVSLQRRGYYFGGVMPQWFGTDGFLMQWTEHTPHFEKMLIYSKAGEFIFDWVKTDFERSRKGLYI